MNHLAHFYLSSYSVALMVGNFIADSVKGRRYVQYPPSIAEGILMHRDIDTYTDTHPLVSQSKQLVRPTCGRYSSIIVDLYYDHFLAVHWTAYCSISLDAFAQVVYTVLETHKSLMPERNRRMLEHMKSDDWLTSYATVEGVHLALQRLSYRMAARPNWQQAHLPLLLHYGQLQKQFICFFNDLKTYITSIWSARRGEPGWLPQALDHLITHNHHKRTIKP
ncbi:MAG: ACP phosphodiesterase [Chitinophagales bacterium]|nr:ACP phosphodiesterase [Chitinophagales bacterium]MDW8427146.1 ACP phosphodiesterase [Chitinophagales bacterium]